MIEFVELILTLHDAEINEQRSDRHKILRAARETLLNFIFPEGRAIRPEFEALVAP